MLRFAAFRSQSGSWENLQRSPFLHSPCLKNAQKTDFGSTPSRTLTVHYNEWTKINLTKTKIGIIGSISFWSGSELNSKNQKYNTILIITMTFCYLRAYYSCILNIKVIFLKIIWYSYNFGRFFISYPDPYRIRIMKWIRILPNEVGPGGSGSTTLQFFFFFNQIYKVRSEQEPENCLNYLLGCNWFEEALQLLCLLLVGQLLRLLLFPLQLQLPGLLVPASFYCLLNLEQWIQ